MRKEFLNRIEYAIWKLYQNLHLHYFNFCLENNACISSIFFLLLQRLMLDLFVIERDYLTDDYTNRL